MECNMWTLKGLIESANSVSTEINCEWYPARPLRLGFISRLKDAWEVLCDRADAFTWTMGQ